MTQFTDLALGAPLLKALAGENYVTPTPIQAQAIPHVLNGRDLLGIAQTGTGKTAAFALPMLERLSARQVRPQPKAARSLILVPTRELAQQVADSLKTYGRHVRLTTTVVVGGVPVRGQIRRLSGGTDVLVATPGRLLDLIDQRALTIGAIEMLVLDEADQMLDLGFIHALRRIVTLVPKERQTLFFSATMPKAIADLASSFITDPVHVSVAPVATTAEKVDQRVVFLEKAVKSDRLRAILRGRDVERAIVFTRTKHGADKVVRDLDRAGIDAAAIHGNKSQGQRQRALGSFKTGAMRVLVATDIAARGIDVDGISHVINFDLPNVAETYVHRIGRTARAGAAGVAISLCVPDERPFLRDIERLTRQSVPLMEGEDTENDPRNQPNFGRSEGGRGKARSGNRQRNGGNGGRSGDGRRNDRGGEGREIREGRRGDNRDARNPDARAGTNGGGRGSRNGESRNADAFAKRKGDGPRKPHRKGGGGNAASARGSRPQGGGGSSAGGPVRFGME